jgi:hypothetical protein
MKCKSGSRNIFIYKSLIPELYITLFKLARHQEHKHFCFVIFPYSVLCILSRISAHTKVFQVYCTLVFTGLLPSASTLLHNELLLQTYYIFWGPHG